MIAAATERKFTHTGLKKHEDVDFYHVIRGAEVSASAVSIAV